MTDPHSNPNDQFNSPEGGAPDAAPVEPTQPVEDELTAAARAAQAGPYQPGGRFKPPNSMLILAGVLILLVGTGVYGIIWMRGLAVKNEKVRLRSLEQRAADFEKQEQFFKEKGYLPAGREAKPLTRAEQDELEALRARYGKLEPGESARPPATLPIKRPGGS